MKQSNPVKHMHHHKSIPISLDQPFSKPQFYHVLLASSRRGNMKEANKSGKEKVSGILEG